MSHNLAFNSKSNGMKSGSHTLSFVGVDGEMEWEGARILELNVYEKSNFGEPIPRPNLNLLFKPR